MLQLRRSYIFLSNIFINDIRGIFGMDIGDKAPEFKLKNKDDEVISLKDIKSDFTVLYFYPKDDTPGCTVEAIEFTKYLPQFKKLKTEIIGISGGTDKTKAKFCTKYDLKISLVSDPDFVVAKKYESFGEKTFMGRKYMGIFRNTFVLDKNKKVLTIFEKVKPEGHAEEVIKFIKEQR